MRMAEAAEARESELHPERARDLARQDGELIDTRRDYEWEGGRLPGARHIELNRVSSEAANLPRDRPLIFYCRGGNRSRFVAEAFRNDGYDAYSIAGGIEAWAAAGLGIEGEIREPLPAS